MAMCNDTLKTIKMATVASTTTTSDNIYDENNDEDNDNSNDNDAAAATKPTKQVQKCSESIFVSEIIISVSILVTPTETC